jgi:hypothetical protein
MNGRWRIKVERWTKEQRGNRQIRISIYLAKPTREYEVI